MTKRQTFYESVLGSGSLVVPETAREQQLVAQALFGAVMVGCVDTSIEQAAALLEPVAEGSPAPLESPEARDLRQRLASLTEAQRNDVLALVKKSVAGMFYWQCVKLDNFPGSDIEIRVTPHSEETDDAAAPAPIVIVAPTARELRHQYYDWIERFSDQVAGPAGK